MFERIEPRSCIGNEYEIQLWYFSQGKLTEVCTIRSSPRERELSEAE